MYLKIRKGVNIMKVRDLIGTLVENEIVQIHKASLGCVW